MAGFLIDPRNPRPPILPKAMEQFQPPGIAAGTYTSPYNLPPPPPPFEADPQQAEIDAQQTPPPLIDPAQAPSIYPAAGPDEEIPEENRWSATGKTDSFGSFFNKRSSTDALTAFGAAMLKAPTFMQGLGDAALAVNQVDRDNRMPTPEEIARANIKARMASGRGAFSAKPLAQGYDDQNGFWTEIMGADGTPIFYGPNGQTSQSPPPGFIDRANSGKGKSNNLQAVEIDTDYKAAATARDNLEDYDGMERLLGDANVGPGAWEVSSRFITKLSGVDFGGAKLSSIQEFQKISKNGELLKAMEQRGLGQFTEMERKIVQEALVTIDTDPEAAKHILKVMKARSQRHIEMVDDWDASGLSENQYRSWKRKWIKDWEQNNGSVYGLPTKETPKSTEELNPEEAEFLKKFKTN